MSCAPLRRAQILAACLAVTTSVTPWTSRAQTAPPPAPSTVMPPSTAQLADPGPTEDMLLARWLANSREVTSWRGQIGAARFDVVTATLWPNPQVALNAMVTAAGTPPDGQVNYGGQISLPLPIFGQIGARRDAAMAALRTVEIGVVATLWARAADIQAAMVDRAFGDARILVLQRNVDELARIVEIIDRRVSAGANSAYDTLRVSTATATLRAAIAQATIERDRAEARIVALVADPSLSQAPITRAGLAAFRGPEDEHALIELAMRRRPDLELARRGSLAAYALADRYAHEVAPTPTAFAGVYVSHGQFSVSVQGGLSFTLPVFDRNQGLIGHSRADSEALRVMAEALTARVRTEVAAAWRARAAARAALLHFRDVGMPTTRALLQRAEVSYREGMFSIMDLLDAYRTTWEARAQDLELERAMASAEAELERVAALVVPYLAAR